MAWLTLFYLLIAFAFVLMNGFFVLAEFALVKVRSTRIEELARQGDRRAIIARQVVQRLDNYLAATQLGITVASLGLGWVGGSAFSGIIEHMINLPGWWRPGVIKPVSTAASFLIITFLHILLGELAPKRLAIHRAEASTLFIARPMRWSYRLFYLPMKVLNGASNLILKLIGIEAGQPEVEHTEQELRMLLSTTEATTSFSLNRLLMLENIFDLGRQTVRDAMIPWSQVRYLSRSLKRDDVIRLNVEHRFSRWPVLDNVTGLPIGYLLAKDLLGHPPDDQNWQRVIRPLRTVGPNENLEAMMQQLQREGGNISVVVDGGRPIGLITLEDILEEVVGRIEDEYPRLPRLFLKDALTNGGVVLDFHAETPIEAISTLVAVIPPQNLVPGIDVAALAADRERQMPTDVGHGVAIPHARCPRLARPVIVFGRSAEGIAFGDPSRQPVSLFFLIVTPAERPNVQVFLLGQLANVARSEFVRERLIRAESPEEVFEIISAADPAVTG